MEPTRSLELKAVVDNDLYVALDLETTGLNQDRDRIIEIGMVKFTPQRVIDTFSSFVNPGRPIPFQITQLTGIRDRDVRDAPSIENLIPQVRGFIGRSTLIGHNVSFDITFLQRAGLRLNNPSIDTFALANLVWPHARRYNLRTLADEMGIEPETSHRALDDAETARRLFLELIQRAYELPLDVIHDINRVAEGSRWVFAPLFRSLERRRARTPFSNTLADQLRAKGFIDDSGAVALLAGERADEEEHIAPAPELAERDADYLAGLLAPDGLVATRFPGYEFRPQQVEMARAIAETLRDKGTLVVEAGTGVGKTVAYLIPAVHFAVAEGKHVVVSTNTINLQDQLFGKDIPDLQRILPFPFRATVLKGRSNYLCLRKLQAMKQSAQLREDEIHALARILIWVQSTTTGDQSELLLPTESDRIVWSYLSADSESCLREDCRYYRRGICFLQRARRRAMNAHIIIVNHSLLLADAAVENAVLPEFAYLIIDEAHHLEEATTSQLSYHISQVMIEHELNWLAGLAPARRAQGLAQDMISALLPHAPAELRPQILAVGSDIAHAAASVRGLCEEVFAGIAGFTQDHAEGSDYGLRLRITEAVRVQPGWSRLEMAWENAATHIAGLRRHIDSLLHYAADISSMAEAEEIMEMSRDLMVRAEFWNQAQAEITAMLTTSRSNRVDWIEVSPADELASLHSAPVHVGDMIHEYLLSPHEAVVFTSATLRTGDDFAFLRERLGIDDARELVLDSPFDFHASTLIYHPTDIPEPSQPFYVQSIAKAVEEVARALRGRTLVLFTSYSQLRRVVEMVGPSLVEMGIHVLVQGAGASRAQLLEQFKEDNHAVLFGTRSFWEGIDVVGQALSCVVITRLPFAVPSEPIFAARAETFEDPFNEYSVPDAILRFRQGFGRLIRSKSDRGAVVILDRRVLSKRYGQLFLRSLPSCTVEHGPLDFVGARVNRWVQDGK